MSAAEVDQPRLSRTAPRASSLPNPHGRQDMGWLDLARRAGGTRRYRNTAEIEANYGRFGL